jgi:hypothetical protein
MASRESHDGYGKKVLLGAMGGDEDACRIGGETCETDLGGTGVSRIDATINGKIAVEIESRVNKQVRGAVLDLLLHKAKKKLLILIPAHMEDEDDTKAQCEFIFRELNVREDNFKVVCLKGTGGKHKTEQDVSKLRGVLKSFGVKLNGRGQ